MASRSESAYDAEAWLSAERRLMEREEWSSPTVRAALAKQDEVAAVPLTFRDYVTSIWLDELDLRPLTRRDYESLLKNHLFPSFGDQPINAISKAAVRTWHARLGRAKPEPGRRPTNCCTTS